MGLLTCNFVAEAMTSAGMSFFIGQVHAELYRIASRKIQSNASIRIYFLFSFCSRQIMHCNVAVIKKQTRGLGATGRVDVLFCTHCRAIQGLIMVPALFGFVLTEPRAWIRCADAKPAG
jgi:hypothetical protein